MEDSGVILSKLMIHFNWAHLHLWNGESHKLSCTSNNSINYTTFWSTGLFSTAPLAGWSSLTVAHLPCLPGYLPTSGSVSRWGGKRLRGCVPGWNRNCLSYLTERLYFPHGLVAWTWCPLYPDCCVLSNVCLHSSFVSDITNCVTIRGKYVGKFDY